ncbi:hypothetical protein [Maritalea porphyrae]|jgi:hypothetical protein|uniref:hypothetical protein n=1 Tax=Maritalea porphyrae TaxID=880732 RepID=UPI0022AF505E|nr:hypothetical protein [Maritalea porphyrae]MCZ4273979.1 hypothetical protein [Maritalea porphyrae]
MSEAIRLMSLPNSNQLVDWQGRTGRVYALKRTSLTDMNMAGNQLCLLSQHSDSGEDALWVGTGDNLIHDEQSRRAFLKAVHVAQEAYVLELADDEMPPLTMIWDLEAAHRNPERHAA